MNEKLNSALDGLKSMAEKTHITDKLQDVGDKIKENLSNIDLKETLSEASDKFKNGGIGDAIHAVGDKIKEAICSDADTEKQGLQDLPGAAINVADQNKVNTELVKERTSTLNNNPRNTDM